MRNFIFLFLILLYSVSSAQQAQIQCGHDEVMSVQSGNNERFREQMLQMNMQIKKYIADNYGGKSRSSQPAAYLIPVVFHIVHGTSDAYGSGANISYARIISQMNALNAAFGMDYANYNGQSHPSYAQNTSIQFCLAKTAMPGTVSFYNGPQGIEHGVMRYASNSLTQHQINNASANALLALTHPSAAHFPFQNYLNIWLVSAIGAGSAGTIMAYAPTPLMNSFPLDGVISRADIIGDNSTGNTFPLGFGLQQGKVLSHEIGHYLNLYHIFQGGCAGLNAASASTDQCDLNGDYICDTDPSQTQNYNCNLPVPNTCAANYNTGTTGMDMIENYMSYADDDCQNTFTGDQTQRMWATLNTLRSNIWQTQNLSATGVVGAGSCMAPFLMGHINLQGSNLCKGVSFTVSNPVAGNSATSRTWSFPGATPASASAASVNVNYPNPGNYWIKLTVSNGTLTTKDSVMVTVLNCTLDSSKLDRSHWYFGDYAEINFATTPASAGNSAFINKTMQNGSESTVSMSDKKGNLLFYTNAVNVWDNKHQKVNTFTPVFHAGSGSSTPGMLSFPMPKDSSKYIIVSSPHTGINYDSLYYVIYDTVLHTVTKRRGFRHPVLPAKFSEPLTAVPHCNGVDYWIICRPYATFYQQKAYSILITPAGPGNIDTVIVSTGINDQWSGQLKANSRGDRLVQANYNTSMVAAYLYDFDKATGVLSNQVPVASLGSGINTGAIFSPNDSIVYSKGNVNNQSVIWKTLLSTMQTLSVSTPPGATSLQFEVGPDNNIYLSQSDYNNVSTARLINCNSFTNVSYNAAVINYGNGINPFGGLCNFVDAVKGPELSVALSKKSSGCAAYTFSVDNCWQLYKGSWSFGDGGTATGQTVSHTYANPGTYTVSLVLSIGHYSLPATIQTVQVLPSSALIAGPNVLCKGSTFLNSYNTTNINGATYTWSAMNGTIATPANQPNVSLSANGTGNVVLNLVVNNDGCTATATKTILIDAVPVITMSVPSSVCISKTATLSGSPAGGVFTGNNVSGQVFTAAAAGTHTVYYSASNANGCSNTGSAVIAVGSCVGLEESAAAQNLSQIFPNPGTGIFYVRSVGEGTVEVNNSLGEVVYKKTFDREIQIDLSPFADAVYIFQVNTSNGSEIHKVIKTAD